MTSDYNSTRGRLSFQVGGMATGSALWLNAPAIVGSAGSVSVLRREFECGVVLLNGDGQPRTLTLEGGLKRLTGQQAPRWQYIVDDNSSAFRQTRGQWAVGSFDSGYDMTKISSEQVRPPNGFYHHWATGAHTAAGAASATFELGVTEAGVYNISMWWADAVPARASWSSKMTITVGTIDTEDAASTTAVIDLRTDGGDVWLLVAPNVELTPGSTMGLSCPNGAGACVADAVLVRWPSYSPRLLLYLQVDYALCLQLFC